MVCAWGAWSTTAPRLGADTLGRSSWGASSLEAAAALHEAGVLKPRAPAVGGSAALHLDPEALDALVGGGMAREELRNGADSSRCDRACARRTRGQPRPRGSGCAGRRSRSRPPRARSRASSGAAPPRRARSPPTGEITPQQAGGRADADGLEHLPRAVLVHHVAQLVTEHAQYGILLDGEFDEPVEQQMTPPGRPWR